MTDEEKKDLFNKTVASKLKVSPPGLIEFPIEALAKYHDAIGLGPDQACFYAFNLPDCDEGDYAYVFGDECASDTGAWIMSVYYLDVETDESEPITPNKVLEKSIYRHLYEKEVWINGKVLLDCFGRVWLRIMSEDNIGAEVMFDLSGKSVGLSLVAEDGSSGFQIFGDSKTFYIAPHSVFRASPLPC